MQWLKQYRQPTDRLPDKLPWAALVAPGVILQKDRILQRTVAFRGRDLGSSSDSELVSSMARLNNALKRLGSGWALFVEAQRYQSSSYPKATFTNDVAWLIDKEREANFTEKGTHYESGYYMTFTWLMPGEAAKRVESVFYDEPAAADSKSTLDRDLQYFQNTVAELVDIMRGVFEDVGMLTDDQTLTYLHSTISTNRHPVRAPLTPMYLDALLPDMPLTTGDTCLLGDSYIPTCTFTMFPTESMPGILDDLNHLQIEYRWVTRYIALSQAEAKKELEKYRKGWWAKRKNLVTLLKEEVTKGESALTDNDASNKAANADEALQALGSDLVSFGYMTVTVTVCDTNAQLAHEKMQSVKQVIQSRGFTVKDETLNSQEAWLGSLPGHVYANVRRPLMNTLNLAHIMPVSAIWAGDTGNKHLREVSGVGESHVTCSTTGSTPFRLNLAVGDVGHTLIVGPTGAGKSTLLGLLELQWLRYPNAQVVIFDKDRSARAATLAVGGNYYEPGSENAPVSFQPLADIHEPQEQIWAAEWISNLLVAQGMKITPEIQGMIDDAIKQLASDGSTEHRTLSGFRDLVQSNTIRETIRPYTVEGNFGQLFDAKTDTLGDGFWQMIEMNSMMDMGEKAVVPALDYLFHKVEKRFDGRPTLLVLDEAWLFLSHPTFMGRIQNWLKTLRKKNVYVVFATQEIADAAESPIMATILSACHTKIYLPDEEALAPAMAAAYVGFGLSETEIRLLTQAQKKRDYYYRSVKGRRMFSLDMGPVALSFAAMSSEDDHIFMDEMEADAEIPPADYAKAILEHRGLDWAADLLTQAEGQALTI